MQQREEFYGWAQIENLVYELALKIKKEGKTYDSILGITNGGIIPAKLLSRELDINSIRFVPMNHKEVAKAEMPILHHDRNYLVVDDIYDTGDTCFKVADALKGFSYDFAFCMSRYKQDIGLTTKVLNHDRWVVFPWE